MKLVRAFAFISLIVLARMAHAQSAGLTVSPSPIVFCGSPGQAVSGIPVTVFSSGPSVQFLPVGVTQGGKWLVIDPSVTVATPEQKVQMVVSIGGGLIPFANGSYSGEIVLTSAQGATLAVVPVLLNVSRQGCGDGSGLLFSSSGPLWFQVTPGGTGLQNVLVSNTFPTTLTVIPNAVTDSGNWLSTLKFNITLVPGLKYSYPLGVGVSGVGLAAGTYGGSIPIQSTNSTDLTLPVTLTVSSQAGAPQLSATPSPLRIGLVAGAGAAAADIQVTNLAPSAVSLSVGSDVSWLTASPASVSIAAGATATVSAGIASDRLVRGVNLGNLRMTTAGGGVFVAPVSVTYGVDSKMTASPSPVSLKGDSSADFVVTSNSGTVAFATTAKSGALQPWLTVRPATAIVSPGSPVTLTATVSGAPTDPAFGQVILIPNDGSAELAVPVHVNAPPESRLTVSPSQAALSYTPGGQAPAPVTLSLSGGVASDYDIRPDKPWLTVIPDTARTVVVQVHADGLGAGGYSGAVLFTNKLTGSQLQTSVSLTVNAVSISVAPAALSFRYYTGPAPGAPVQTLRVSTGAAPVPFTVSASPFLQVTASGGSTPATVAVALIGPAPVGDSIGSVTVGLASGEQAVARVTVSPRVDAVVNAASLQAGALAGGELVTIFGGGFGPDSVVTFDGVEATLLYGGDRQINALVPLEIAGNASTAVSVTGNGAASNTVAFRVAAAAPAIFSVNQSGGGQGAILNQDNSPNSADNPAVAGSTIQMFGTGAGLGLDDVAVSIGGVNAQVVYAGQAPGLAGILQVNAVVPRGLAAGAQGVVLRIGGADNRAQGISVAVK